MAMNFRGASFTNGTKFEGTIIPFSDFRDLEIGEDTEAVFDHCDVAGSDFRGTDLSRVKFRKTKINGLTMTASQVSGFCQAIGRKCQSEGDQEKIIKEYRLNIKD